MLELRHQLSPHYTGLRAEADTQLNLQQISAEEHQWLTTVLDAPERTEERQEVVVARALRWPATLCLAPGPGTDAVQTPGQRHQPVVAALDAERRPVRIGIAESALQHAGQPTAVVARRTRRSATKYSKTA